MSDRIALTGIEVHARHGVLPHERELGQRFVIDAVLELDLAPAAASDDLADTVDYGTLAADLARLAVEEPVALLETLGERLANRCLADPRVRVAEVTVHKPSAPVSVVFQEMAVTIVRRRA